MATKKRVSRSVTYTVDSKGNRKLELREEWVEEVSEPVETPRKTPWTATIGGIILLSIVGNWLFVGTQKAAACLATALDCMVNVLADLHAVIQSLLP